MSARVTKITMLVDTAPGQASVAELNASLTGNEKAFQANAVAASASLTQIERLLVVRNELKQQTVQVTAALRGENAALAEYRAVASQSASAAAQLSGTIKVQEDAILRLLVEQQQLTIATTRNNVALKGYSAAVTENTVAVTGNVVANQALVVAQQETAVASELSTGHMVRVGVAISHLDGLAIHGGRSISHLTEAFSAMSLGQLAVIAGAAILIGWLVQRMHAEEKLIEINQEALKLDLARAKTSEGQQNLTKDLTALLIGYQVGIKSLAADQLKETEAYYALAAAEKVEDEMKARGVERSLQAQLTGKLLGVTLEDQKHKYQELTEKRQKDEESLHKTIEALVQFARESNQSTAQILAAARAYGVAGKALADLTVELTGATLAQRRLNAVIEAQKAPQVDYTKTREGVLPLQESVKSGMSEAAAAGVKRYDDQVRANSKSLGELSSAVKNHTIAMSDLNAETQQAVRRHEQLTEKHHAAAGGAKAYANELVNLTKKAEDAEAALLGDSFARREAAIQADIKSEREHLVINKRDRDAANAAIDREQKARLEKLSNDRVEAEQSVMVEIAKINIEGNESVIGRRLQSAQLEIALRVAALKKDFGDTAQTQDLIVLYRQAKEAEYARWFLDLTTKNEKARKDAEFQMMDEVQAERLRRDKKVLDEAVRLAKNRAAAEQAVGGQIGGTLVSPASAAQVAGLTKQIQQLGPAFLEAGKDANVVKRAFDQVDKLFGFVGKDAHTLALQLKALELYGKGDAFGGLKMSLKALGSELIHGGTLAMGFADTLANAFSQSLGNSNNFIRSMGASLVQGMTAIIGQTLQQLGMRLIAHGITDILIGNAINSDPFTFGMGFPMIAAGHAEIAQGIIFGAAGGIVSGLGQAAANKINPQTGSSASSSASVTGGSSSSTSAASPAARDRVVQPALLDVATSPRSAYDSWVDRAFGDNRRRADQEAINQRNSLQADSGPVTIELHLSADEALDLLMKGKGVVRLDNLGTHKQRIRRALGVQ